MKSTKALKPSKGKASGTKKSRGSSSLRNRKGVFGLTSVQAFFTIILGLALLAYVVVVIMGTLQSNSSLFPDLTTTVVNESGWVNGTAYTVSTVGVPGFNGLSVILVNNRSNQVIITSSNYTVNAASGTITLVAGSPNNYSNANITYSYSYFSNVEGNGQSILGNTSSGITSFFTSINPVYAILAVLVIILVLVVLVRVVSGQAGNLGGGQSREPQL